MNDYHYAADIGAQATNRLSTFGVVYIFLPFTSNSPLT